MIEVQAKLEAGEPYVIRFNMPTEGTTTFHDDIYGDITVPNNELDDLILIKSDGFPTYNFANVVDDHLMGITHVVRGNEYLSSSPKYNRIYEAFGWEVPTYVHCPLITNEEHQKLSKRSGHSSYEDLLDQGFKYNRIYEAFGWEVPTYVHCPLITNEEHQKLSKRSGHSSYEDLLDQGFLTEAIVNYVALLGWCPQDNQEIFSLEELVKVFDYHHMSKSPAVFDIQKLKWMNGEYMKAMDEDKFYEMALPYIKQVITKDYHHMSKSPAVFDIQKLKWMNGEYMKAMDEDKFYEMALPYIKQVITKDLDLKKIAHMAKTRIEVLPDIPALIDFFEAVPEYDVSMYTHKKMKTNPEISLEVLEKILPVLETQEDYSNDALYELLCNFAKENMYTHKKMKTNPEISLEVLEKILPVLETQEDYSNDALYELLCNFAKENGYKNGQVLWPIRTALSGKQMTPAGATEILEVLGKEESLKRIRAAVEKLK